MIVFLSMGCLTCCTRFDRESEFGFKDRDTENVNVKIYLWGREGGKYIHVVVNGEREKGIYGDESLCNELLAGKPLKFKTACGP